jgi:transcriptional regulator with XRE-family HTH domain
MTRDSGRTPRQVFGAMLRYHRERAGLSRPDLARQVNKSVSLIQAIELGQRAATPEVTADLEQALSADGALTRLREEIGDGLGYQPYPAWFQDWVASEREAQRIRLFGPVLIPGLLQTPAYARAIFATRFGATEEEIDEQVTARLKRQDVIDREDPPAVWAIVDEAALRRPVGGQRTMQEQVGHLLKMARQPHVSVQVISTAVGVHLGLCAGGFAVADFDEAPAVGYQETVCQGQFIDHQNDVRTLITCWDTLVREALPWAASEALLEEVAKSWTSAR